MKNGAWTEPGIQSREKRTFVSARADWTAVSERAANTTAAMQRARNVTFTSLFSCERSGAPIVGTRSKHSDWRTGSQTGGHCAAAPVERAHARPHAQMGKRECLYAVVRSGRRLQWPAQVRLLLGQ